VKCVKFNTNFLTVYYVYTPMMWT